MTTPNDAARPVKEFPGMKLNESPCGGRWWALGADTVKDFPLGDYIPAAWLDELQADYDALRADRDCWERQADDRLKDWASMRAEVGVWRARAEAAEAIITETRKHLNFAMLSSNPQEIHDRVLAACAALNEGGE